MRLDSSSLETSKQTRAIGNGSEGLIIGISIGASVFIVLSAALVCLLYRRRLNNNTDHHTTLLLRKLSNSDRPLSLRRSTAVKSPGGSATGPTLKKSPSPTGTKSPPSRDQEERLGERKSLIDYKLTKDSSSERLKKLTNSIIEKPVAIESIGDLNQQQKSHNQHNQNDHQNQILETNKSNQDYSTDNQVNHLDEMKQLGKLHFKLKYNYEKQALCIVIGKATGLPIKENNLNDYDPYVKLQLLPDKQHKVKTRVLRKTDNPIYDEEFIFYEITPDMLERICLHFLVLSFDRYSRDDVIGEVFYQLGHLHFDTLEKQVSLVEDICPRSMKIRSQGRGEVLVSLCYQPAANRLTVVVLKARNLPKIDVNRLCDPFVKIYLLYNGQRIAKKKTHVKKHTTDPVFNESFVFDVPSSDSLDSLSLEFMVLDYDRETKNEIIGKLEIGSKSGPTAVRHWQEVSASPRRQIAEWHNLRE
ncbi:synaptotagmin-11-like [Panonychus citri]|uniref:synaptotagmin-11-like n=1 Tax=Panonychus citri TaxID=50023 RepID=UPI002307CB0C|nr:synaptotagmin-11-like [Panonychus citri]